MYAVVVTFTVKPEHRAAFAALMAENAAASRRESACRQFDVCTDPARPDEVFLYELYDDRAGFDAHLDMAHFKAFKAAIAPMIDGVDLRGFESVVQ
ncbi:putative quinol monooxygenase [Hasllibacter sp. MH4015]|uniref:putative quinol monooxygenase n=1 Tax=Hasllibacter sp. MH4015 TaxID=2854029 RepID=UPI001CD5336E|nr:putative quinol monooxygenase [Hasllibacter sp. MH4015]